jgi:predicted metal-dependent phosphoesterase TrpH
MGIGLHEHSSASDDTDQIREVVWRAGEAWLSPAEFQCRPT